MQVGNQAFADYVDAQPVSFTRINNKEDPVPVLPPIQVLGYHHVSGEIHIRDDDIWVSCPGESMRLGPAKYGVQSNEPLGFLGQDNPSVQCSAGAVTVLNWNASQHVGPYDGVTIGGC